MAKHRIVLVDTVTAFRDPVRWYAVQVRVALFWWVTVTRADSIEQARYWLYKSGAPNRPEKVIKVIE